VWVAEREGGGEDDAERPGASAALQSTDVPTTHSGVLAAVVTSGRSSQLYSLY